MNQSKKADLHIHSFYSDSDTSIEEIFQQAKDKNLSCIAITDHDNIDGIEEAKNLSKIYNIEFIEGIEISAQKNDIEVHILGYFIDYKSRNLTEDLKEIKELRRERLIRMIEKLNCLGFKLNIEDFLLKIKSGIPTRLHLALYLVEKKIVNNVAEAFNKYLSPGKPAYIARFKYSVKEAINLIKNNGGLAFLAHPHLLGNDSWIEEFVSYNLDGIETRYPKLSKTQELFYDNLAKKLGILRSGGSDFHGKYKEFTKIGETTISYEWVEKIKQYKPKISIS